MCEKQHLTGNRLTPDQKAADFEHLFQVIRDNHPFICLKARVEEVRLASPLPRVQEPGEGNQGRPGVRPGDTKDTAPDQQRPHGYCRQDRGYSCAAPSGCR